MRLIDADALIQEWYRVNNIDEDDRGARFIGYTEIPRFIANAPTVSAESEQVTGKLKKTCDSLLTDDTAECKEQKSKLDLISRQWLLDLYETPKDGEGVDWKVPLEVVRQNILDAPSAEAVQGEWKRVPTRTYKGECTNCGFRHIFMDGHDSQYRFCPNCGARMTPYKGGDSE